MVGFAWSLQEPVEYLRMIRKKNRQLENGEIHLCFFFFFFFFGD